MPVMELFKKILCDTELHLPFIYRGLPFPKVYLYVYSHGAIQCNSAAKTHVCCCYQALILNTSLVQQPTSAGTEPKFILSFSPLVIILTPVLCPVSFICLIQFFTANDSELEGNYREK